MNPESFESKLYVPRDVEGKPNTDELQLIRELEQELSANEAFVALAPFGSTMGGYGNENSDLDLFLLYCDPESGVPPTQRAKNSVAELHKQVASLKANLEKSGRKVDIIALLISPNLVIKEIKRAFSEGRDLGDYVAQILEAMTRVTTGQKINQYRAQMAAEIAKLEPSMQAWVKRAIIKQLSKRDAKSLQKRQQRFPDLDHKKILQERKKLWAERVEKIWGLNSVEQLTYFKNHPNGWRVLCKLS